MSTTLSITVTDAVVAALKQRANERGMTPELLAANDIALANHLEPIAPMAAQPVALRPGIASPTQEDLEYRQKLLAAKSLDELLVMQTTAAPFPSGYSLCDALNAHRAESGERPLYRDTTAGT